MSKPAKLRVVIVEPGQYAREAEIDNTLEAEQAVVGGLIDVICPWPDDKACLSEEASMYCFPSKLFEYMKTGNPVLSFRIGGIPDEYFEHLIPVEKESVTAVKAAMLEAMKMPKESRLDFGKKAKDFIMTQKNTAKQTKLIYDLVEGEK